MFFSGIYNDQEPVEPRKILIVFVSFKEKAW